MGKISFHSHHINFKLSHKRAVGNWLKELINKENKKTGAISFVFCNDEYLLTLNNEFLQHDTLTDIITFDYTENLIIKGDVFISIDRVNENADKFKVTFQHELLRVIVHGVLHLCGYKDKSLEQKTIMRGKEDFYLKKVVPI
jgi:probable rRNA maturation factor